MGEMMDEVKKYASEVSARRWIADLIVDKEILP